MLGEIFGYYVKIMGMMCIAMCSIGITVYMFTVESLYLILCNWCYY